LNAPKKMAKLFDFTCHHCRDLHHLLSSFRAKHSNELAVISLPLPLNADCNPTVKRTQPAHVDACEFARYALAVSAAAVWITLHMSRYGLIGLRTWRW